MSTVTVTINGLTAGGRAGMTILELAREMGIRIPTLCHDEYLTAAGACRVCLVEEEKSGALLASCVAPISPGMVICTDSTRVLEARRMVVKLMLASHPESCLLCDKGNRCQLRLIAAELGIGLLDLYKLPSYSGTQEVNPFIKRDLSKCILCGKCIRADHELVVEGAIDYFQRGFEAKPATLHDQPLEESECTFCGTCVSLCPTGALSEKDKPSLGTALSRVPSVCPYCSCGCAISLGTNGLGLVDVEPDRKRSSVNQATLCVKGRYGWEFTRSPERLKTPLIRRDGKLAECSSEEALDFVAGELLRVRSQRGPDALAFLGSSKCTNEENYLFQKLARAAVGTNNIDNGSRLHGPPSPQIFGAALGWGTMTSPIANLEESRCILVIGANPEETAPIMAYKIKRAVRFKQAQLILVDPRWTKLVPFARPWLRPRWGTDGALILGLIRTILNEGLWDRQRIEEKVEGWEKFLEEMKAFGLQWVERETGIDKSLLQGVARDFAAGRPAAIVFGNGIRQSDGQLSVLHALVNLALLTDCFGLKGGGFFPLGKENNGQGARDMGALPEFLPGYQSPEDAGERKRFEDVWGKPLPRQKGLTAWEMMAAARDGKIQGMYIMGENPARSFPDSSYVREGLGRLDFLVVQDLFLTETANSAHVVLPACSFTEKEGTMTNAERRVQRLMAAEDPKEGSLPDWKILVELSGRMGLSKKYSSPREILEEINDLVPMYRGITYERVEKESLYWPCTGIKHPGSPHLSEKGFPSGRRRFFEVRGAGLAERKLADGSFRLILGSNLFHFGSGTRSSKSPKLMGFCHQRNLRMNPEDAGKMGLEEGGLVRVYSKKREMAFSICLDSGLPAGTLFLPVSPGNESVYDFLTFPSDLKAEFPGIKTVEVKIERI
ncbi:MAG: molybdopterin-dependent oxidoreductase [Deltaproteobacteria bacterium]|nr:molybdopterin-dependent oxidoreductase [Deltaproteobacteria bacterium]